MDFRAAFKDPGGCTINISPAFDGGGFLIRACHFSILKTSQEYF